jgi:hypothetical protein
MKTEKTIKLVKRSGGWSARIEMPWGERVRLSGYKTRDAADLAAAGEVNRRMAVRG